MENKRSVNLCSKFVLPLLGLNKFSFDNMGSSSRFVNSYVSQDDRYIVVESTHPFTAVITNGPNYRFSMQREENHLAVFEVPVYYREDVVRFRKGEYSKMTNSAKELIRKKSGLIYRAPGKNGLYTTAFELLALDKDPTLKKHWEEELGVKLSDDAELYDIPGDDNFFELKIENKLETV